MARAEAEDQRRAGQVVGLLGLDDAVLHGLERPVGRKLELGAHQHRQAALLGGGRGHVDPLAVAARGADLEAGLRGVDDREQAVVDVPGRQLKRVVAVSLLGPRVLLDGQGIGRRWLALTEPGRVEEERQVVVEAPQPARGRPGTQRLVRHVLHPAEGGGERIVARRQAGQGAAEAEPVARAVRAHAATVQRLLHQLMGLRAPRHAHVPAAGHAAVLDDAARIGGLQQGRLVRQGGLREEASDFVVGIVS